MALTYPVLPAPASISAMTIIDPSYEMMTDFGYSIRRARYPRPRRFYTLTYLGLTTLELRFFQHFFVIHRLRTTAFSWYPHLVYDTGTVLNTTPIRINVQHPYVGGQWVVIGESTVPNLNGFYQVTTPDGDFLLLNNTTARGVGTCHVGPFLPNAILRTSEDGELPAPEKLMGPESIDTSRGRFSMIVGVEEIF
jgi:hypothetical protein